MFKKGQRVRRTAGAENDGMKIGDIATVVREDGDKLFLEEYEPDEGCTFYTGYFELVKETKCQEYTVRVTSPNLLNTNDVYEELSRDTPLAIIKGDDGTVKVVIHDSIRRKVRLMEDTYSYTLDNAEKNLMIFNKLSDGYLKDVIKAVKDIRYGSIKAEYKNPVEYTVTIPEM